MLFILFLTFFKIGLFSFGGGYAMLPMIYQEVVEKTNWITPSEFTDLLAISQITPGPISVNSATYVGILKSNGILGAASATFGVILPSFIITIILCHFIVKFKNNIYIKSIFNFLRPIVVGFIFASSILLMNKANFTDWKSGIIFFFSCMFSCHKKTNPIFIIICSAAIGIVLYKICAV